MLKHKSLFFFLLCMHLYTRLFAQSPQNLPPSCRLPGPVEYMLNCFANAQMEKNPDLVLVEKISSENECSGKINQLGFFFDIYKDISLHETRRLIVSLVNDLLADINRNEKMKKHLKECPFTANDIIIRLRMRNKDCGFIYPKLNNIAFVSAIDGLIIYDTLNSFTYDLDTLRTETFAEALRILSINTPFLFSNLV